MAAYMASKAGLIGLTSGAANDLGPHGVTVNAVSPALTLTDMAAAAARAGTLDQREFDHVLASQAVKQPGHATDVVGLIVFLASDAAQMITGQFIAADGGMTR
jgi:NAD(P)-dependent dehydrogenase (short-subunit alcohol dehydrogenase family)